jgi:hypothetical protein
MEHNIMEAEVQERAACDCCGRFGAYDFGDQSLCVDCYEGAGSCCPEFGEYDLWRFSEERNQGHPSEV